MLLSEIISEIGYEIDRNDIDARIKQWIQASIDYIAGLLPQRALERTETLTTVTDQETLNLPADFGNIISLTYAPGDGTGYVLNQLSPDAFFGLYADQTTSSKLANFCIYDGQIYFGPLPSDAYSLKLRYKIVPANIYAHSLGLVHSASAATDGVQIYIDEDAVRSHAEINEGKLYFVSPTEENGFIELTNVSGHVHLLKVFHSANAATLGVAVYFDEDANNTDSDYARCQFVSPTGKDCVVSLESNLSHKHYLRIKDNPAAASVGVAIYLDEDVTTKANRIRFVSPTTTNGASETALSLNNHVSEFVTKYYEAILLRSVIRGHLFNQKYEQANALKGTLTEVLAGIASVEIRKKVSVSYAKPFGYRRDTTWDALKWPEIDD